MGIRRYLHFLIPVTTLTLGLFLYSLSLPDLGWAAVTDTPTTMATDILTDWVLGEGMLYWASRCPGGEFTGPGYLRRMPSGGGYAQTLATTTGSSCTTFAAMLVQPEGLYYYSYYYTGAILFKSSTTPTADPTTIYSTASTADAPVEGSFLVAYGDYLYWISSRISPTASAVHRVKKDGSGYQQLYYSSGSFANSIDVVFGSVIWTDTNGLWYLNPCDTAPCSRYNLSSISGRTLAHSSTGFFSFDLWWSDTDASPDRLLRTACAYYFGIYPSPSGISCGGVSTFYTAPDSTWNIGQARRAGNDLFWSERKAGSGPTDGRVRRKSVSGGDPQDIVVNMRLLDDALAVDSLYVYFANLGNDPSGYSGGIYRLPLNASAIVRDLRADWFEVTQGIQNRGNTVPLTADKTTVVRGYGLQSSGPNTPAVDAVLHGTRGGSSLPGSPLSTREGTLDLQPSGTYDRGILGQSWFFELPASWISAGTVQFRLEVDPNRAYPDPDRANNSSTQSLTFTAKGPACTVFIPVRTNAPTPHTSDPNFGVWLDMAKRLWPTRAFWPYRQDSDVAELEACWAWGFIPYPCYGPYELPDDTWKVLLSLKTRDAFSDDPDECDDAGGFTHYVGMVHPATNTGDTNGSAYMDSSAAWVKMPPHTPTSSTDFDFPQKGGTLAHELGHNANRKHVDCGDPDDPDSGYPYPTNQIANAGQNSYYGFEVRTQTVLAPTSVADLMGYCQPRWPSDYTWRAFYSWLNAGRRSALPAYSSVLTAAGAVYATGSVAASGGSGALRYAYIYPTSAMSSGMREKWSTAAVEAASSAASYSLRIKDAANNILASPTIALLQAADAPAGTDQAFMTVFSAPATPASKVELMENGAVLATLTMGSNVPTVTVTKPTAGETVDSLLTVEWQAVDSNTTDILLYTIQYSPNNGTTWSSLATDYVGVPGSSQSYSVDLPAIAATSAANQGRIRVLASDGFNTGMGQSAGFTVANRKPEAYLLVPTPGETFAAGKLPVLRGMGFDIEDGYLSGSSLAWRLLGLAVGNGEQLPAGGLQPGVYPLALTATDKNGATGEATGQLVIRPLGIPLGSSPSMDGYCTDNAYTTAVELMLSSYQAGDRATVRLLRSNDYLWACFSGLKTGAASPGAIAGLMVDPDNDGGSTAQADDFYFFVGENGTPYTYKGNGSGSYALPGPGGLQAQVGILDQRWSAELRIDKTVLGGWDKLVGMAFAHLFVANANDSYFWPYLYFLFVPDTWARTALGELPVIESLSPSQTYAGGGSFTLTIHGKNFTGSAVALWNGTSLATTFVDSTQVTAPVNAAAIASVGVVQVKIKASASSTMESNSLPFVVTAQAPVIASLSPSQTSAGSPDFVLAVTGTAFHNGDTVYWNQRSLATTYVNSARLNALVPAALLADGAIAGVTVRSDSPDGGAMSNTMLFPVRNVPRIHLPLVFK